VLVELDVSVMEEILLLHPESYILFTLYEEKIALAALKHFFINAY